MKEETKEGRRERRKVGTKEGSKQISVVFVFRKTV